MYELWAKRRPINGRGYPYEWICNFEHEKQKFYITDQLDREIYQECSVLKDGELIFYRDFERPLVRRLKND